MKKKKLLTTLVATAALCGVAFTLYGCNNQTEPEPTKYTVTYAKGAQGATGTAPTETSHAKGETFTVASNTFTYEGYTFENWSDGTSTYAAGVTYTMPEGNVTFTAQWKANEQPTAKEFTVTFKNGETTVGTPKKVKEGDAVGELPAAPAAAEGKKFNGWYVGGTKIDATYVPTADVTVEAKWDNLAQYTVTYKNGETTLSTQRVYEGGGITLPETPAAAEGKKFNGWYVGETKIDETYKPTADVTVEAKWDNLAQYTVTFKNGETTVDSKTVYEGGKVTLPVAPAKNGFTFKGWQTADDTAFDENAVITANMELQATWEISFKGYWTGNQSIGTVQIIPADGENGIVGYAYYMLMVFSIQEGTDGFVLDPVGIGDAMFEGMSFSLTYEKTADKPMITLTSTAPDPDDPNKTNSQTSIFNKVRELETTKFYNGNYSVVNMGGGDEGGGGESQPEARDAAQPEAVAKKITHSNGAFTAVGFEELEGVSLANPLVFEGAYVFTGTKDGNEYCAYFADYGLIDSIMSVYSGSAVGKELLVFMYLDESITSLEEPPMYLLTKDLARWGSTEEEIVYYDLYKGQSIIYVANIASDPVKEYDGLVAQILPKGLNDSFLVRSDTYGELAANKWGTASNKFTVFGDEFNKETYMSQAKGGFAAVGLTLQKDGTLVVQYALLGSADGSNPIFVIAYTSVEKYDSLTVGFARDGVEVSMAGIMQAPVEEFDVSLGGLEDGELPNVPRDYTIPYDKSGTTTFTLPEEEPTREGYNFKGWALSGNGGEPVLYQAGATITLTDEYTYFYADFEEITYTVTVETGDDKVELPDYWEDKFAAECKVYLPYLERTGYTLTGWTVKFGNQDISVNGEEYNWFFTMPEGNVTATAIWQANEYTIEYVSGVSGATGMPAELTITKNYGEKFNLPAAPAATGFVFAGWQADWNGVIYEAGAEYTVTDRNVMFTAQWTEAGKFSATYSAGEGVNDAVNIPQLGSYAAGETVTLSPDVPTREDYDFAEWKVYDSDNKEIAVTGDTFVMPEGNVTIVAQWTEKEYEVTYSYGVEDSSLGNLPADTKKYKKDEEVTISDEKPTRTDYAFDGWTVTDLKGNAVEVDGNKFNMPAGGATITAQWKLVYTVTLKLSDTDTEAYGTVKVVEGGSVADELAKITAPAKDYFRFDGWYIGSAKLDDSYAFNGNVTAIAKFTQTEALPSANQNPTEDNPIVIGTDGTVAGTEWTGYRSDVENTPAWVGKIARGEKLVITGIQKSRGLNVWDGLIYSIFTDVKLKGQQNVCFNHANMTGAGAGDLVPIRSTVVDETGAEINDDSNYVDRMKELNADCNITIVWDWSITKNTIFLTIKYEKAGKSAEVVYGYSAKVEQTLADHYSIGLDMDGAYAKLNSIVKTTVAEENLIADVLTIGTAGNTYFYTHTTPLYSEKLKKGGKVVFTGEMTSPGTGNFQTIGALIYGEECKGYFRMDWCINGENDIKTAENWNIVFSEGPNWDGGSGVQGDFSYFQNAIKNCTFSLTFDWTNENEIVIFFDLTSKAENHARETMKYTITATEGNALLSEYTIGLGTDHAFAAFTSIVRTPAN